MVRIRSIYEAYQMLRTDDPDTRVTVSLIRRLVADGALPSIRAGRKIMINYDTLLAYLSSPCKAEPQAEVDGPTVRPVPVKIK